MRRLLDLVVFTLVCLALLFLSTGVISSVSFDTDLKVENERGATGQLQGWANWVTIRSVATPTTIYLPLVSKNWIATPSIRR